MRDERGHPEALVLTRTLIVNDRTRQAGQRSTVGGYVTRVRGRATTVRVLLATSSSCAYLSARRYALSLHWELLRRAAIIKVGGHHDPSGFG